MPASTSRPILAITINGTGLHPQSFRQVDDRNAYLTLDHYQKTAEWAHKGSLDSLWIPDLPMAEQPSNQAQGCTIEPTQLLQALAARVPDIGVVPTISTSYSHPFTVARQIATLDALSGGRAGINAVTSYNAAIAKNFGEDQVPGYDERHKRAAEFIDLIGKLSDSWKPSPAGSFDAEQHLFNSEDRRPIDFKGDHYTVRGPLTVPQSPYGRPLVSVAGGSEQSYNLAASSADVIYTAAVNKDAAREVYDDLRVRVQKAGRPHGALKVLPGLTPVIGSTEEEAWRKAEWLAGLAGDEVDPVKSIARLLALDPEQLHSDRQLTEEQMTLPKSWSRPIGFFHSITDVARREQLTVRQLHRRFLLDVGHGLVIGTPETVANYIEDWWRSGAADGFIIRAQLLPEDAQLIAEQVIPILRSRGLFPDGYRQESLRQRFQVAG